MIHSDSRGTAGSFAIGEVRHDGRGWCGTSGTANATAQRIGAAVASGRRRSGAATSLCAPGAASRSVMTRPGIWITTMLILRWSIPLTAPVIGRLRIGA